MGAEEVSLMGRSIVRVQTEGGAIHWGEFQSGAVKLMDSPATNLRDFLASPGRPTGTAQNFHFLSPVTAPCQIICQGKNYLDHILETGVKPKDKDFNLLFTKADSSLAPPAGSLPRPRGVRLLDYELELGLVIGKELPAGAAVTDDTLGNYVAGFVMANDVSARDVQIPERQWFKGKSFRGFCPVGPVLYLAEPAEVKSIFAQGLELELRVNGEKRQKASTRQLIHGPAATLTEIARVFDLRPGDLLLTGTPGGVAMRVKPKTQWQEVLSSFKSEKQKFADFVTEQALSPRYLKTGDRIESTIRSADGGVDLGLQKLLVTD